MDDKLTHQVATYISRCGIVKKSHREKKNGSDFFFFLFRSTLQEENIFSVREIKRRRSCHSPYRFCVYLGNQMDRKTIKYWSPRNTIQGKSRERLQKNIMETRAVLTQYARTKLEYSRRCFFIPIVMYSTAKMDTGSGKRGLAWKRDCLLFFLLLLQRSREGEKELTTK